MLRIRKTNEGSDLQTIKVHIVNIKKVTLNSTHSVKNRSSVYKMRIKEIVIAND